MSVDKAALSPENILRRFAQRAPVYGTFIRTAFLKMLAYRLRYVTGILTYILLASVHFFIWDAVYANREAGSKLNGYSLAEMFTYISVGWVARSFYFSNIDEEIDDLVTTGDISIYLLRPVEFQAMMLAQAAGESLFRILFFSTPIGVVMFLLFPVLPPASMGSFVLFSLATILGFVTFAQLNFVVGLLAFDLKSIEGIMRAKYYLVQLCSGLLLPMAFFPEWAQEILSVLPFKNIAYVPLELYLGRVTGSAALEMLFGQVVWIAGLGLLGYLMWSRAVSKLTLQGG